MRYALVFAAAALLPGAPLAAQESEVASENAIVVTAQRSGAPMWTIDTEAGTVILVGEIRAVPEATPWRPERLEDATARADRVILRAAPKISPGDILRLIFRGGRFTKLPGKTVAADYLDPAQRARLAALEERYDRDYSRSSFLMSAFDLLARRLDFDDDTLDDATEVVEEAAEDADIPITRPERFRGEDLLDDLAAAPPESHIPCLEAAMAAAEAGPAIIERRGRDWRRYDVPAVMANPLEIALGQCWPWAETVADEGDAEAGGLGARIRQSWTDMIAQAAQDGGVTLAVVPLRVLAEEGGVLDRLEQAGLLVDGPEWRAP